MSSIVSPKRIEALAAGAVGDRRAATVLAAIILTVLLVTFRPFEPEGPAASAGGDIVNQLGFGSLGVVAMFGLLAFAEPRRAAVLLSPWWLALLALLALGVLNALDPASAMRAALFSLLALLAVAAVVTLPRDGEAFTTVFLVAGFVVIGLNYAGLLLAPGLSIHAGGGYEPQHEGFWRGAFSHKNVAGPVMACLAFAGLYLFRRGRRRAGAVLFVAALVFMANTGSKTTAGLVPIAILLVMGPRLVGMSFLTPFIFAAVIVGSAVATIGIVFFEPVTLLADRLMDDPTYTGRTALWRFSAGLIAERPWTGFGYESVWRTPLVFFSEQHFDREWDIRGIVHGHNSYLDLASSLGLPALALAVMALLVAPARDYARTPPLRENVLLADFYMMCLMFTAQNAFLESFFFRRADPVWLFMALAAFGLRLNARMPLAVGTPRPGS